MFKGNVLMNDGHTVCDNSQYEKYGCRLTILREGGLDDGPDWQSPDKLIKRMNFPTCCDLSYLRGDFFTSKKGTKIFKIKPDGASTFWLGILGEGLSINITGIPCLKGYITTAPHPMAVVVVMTTWSTQWGTGMPQV